MSLSYFTIPLYNLNFNVILIDTIIILFFIKQFSITFFNFEKHRVLHFKFWIAIIKLLFIFIFNCWFSFPAFSRIILSSYSYNWWRLSSLLKNDFLKSIFIVTLCNVKRRNTDFHKFSMLNFIIKGNGKVKICDFIKRLKLL